MMSVPLSVNGLIPRAKRLFAGQEIVSRLPDKSLRRHSYADLTERAQALAHALQAIGVQPGDRVATAWRERRPSGGP